MTQECSAERDCMITALQAQHKGFNLSLEEAGNRSSSDGAKFLWDEEIVAALWDSALTNGEEVAENKKVEVN